MRRQKPISVVRRFGQIASYITLLAGTQLLGAEYSVMRGVRTPVPLNRITESNTEEGIIRIKLTEKTVEKVRSNGLSKRARRRSGIASIDGLNDRFGVTSYTGTFSGLYTSRSMMNRTERHTAWGFDRWLDVKISKGSIREAVEAFSNVQEVEIAEPVYKKVQWGNESQRGLWMPNDPELKDQWHYHNTGQAGGTAGADIDLPEAWESERGFEEVLVAIVDGGIEQDHPDLKANLWKGGGYNFVEDTDVIVGDGHGTHVAGTVAATNNNGLGVSGVAGGSGNGDGVRLMSCQIFTATSFGGSHLALIWAADNGAVIAQNSWGYGDSLVFNQVDLDAIDYFNENGGGDVMEKGVAFFSAGNRGLEGTYYPGCYEGAFSVAATTNKDQRASYSNYGTWVDIAAPGGDRGFTGVLSTLTGGKYGYKDGTSMATPHVSGVAALVLSAAHRNGVRLTATQLKEILQRSCDDIFPADIKSKMGAGRVNAQKALTYLQETYLTSLVPPLEIDAKAESYSEVSINWKKNKSAMDVLLVASTENSFASPVKGATYSAGDVIGGGTVVYVGAAESTIQSDLFAGDSVYYRIYSIDGTDYSGYRSCAVVTDHFTEAGTDIDPIVVDNLSELKTISSFPRYWDKHIVLTKSLNGAVSREWNNGTGWQPIGSNQVPFTGTFNGRGHIVDSLFMRRSGDYSAFFGLVDGGSVDSLGITNVQINGKAYSAGVVGRLNPGGKLSNCFATGNISGNSFVGGVGGLLKESVVKDCYSHVVIKGGQYTGGFVGSCFNMDIKNCYSTGTVSGESNYGGFAGVGAADPSCYWDTESSQIATSVGGQGKSTAQMKQKGTFSGWDFSSIWQIKDGAYPSLLWEENAVSLIKTEEISASGSGISLMENPVMAASGGVDIIVKSGEAARVKLRIFDNLGTLLDESEQFTITGSAAKFFWDLRNRNEQYVGSGSYLVKATVTTNKGTVMEFQELLAVQK